MTIEGDPLNEPVLQRPHALYGRCSLCGKTGVECAVPGVCVPCWCAIEDGENEPDIDEEEDEEYGC